MTPSFSISEMSLIVSYAMAQERKNCHIHGKQPFILIKVREMNALAGLSLGPS